MSMYLGQPKKFEKLWPRWMLGTARNPLTLWPAKSIVQLVDIQYAADRQGFNQTVDQVMEQMNNVYIKHDLLQALGKESKEDVKYVLKLSKRQINRYNNLIAKSRIKPPRMLLSQLYSFYESLCSTAIHMAVPPNALAKLQPNLIEIFGTPFNTVTTYCSPLELEKQYCGSLGSAFDVMHDVVFAPNTTLHINPPFDADMIDKICSEVDGTLQRSPDIDIFVLLPCWDNELQANVGFRNMGEPSCGYRMLQNSPFCLQTILLERESFPFYDHFSGKLRCACHIVLTILTNKPINFHKAILHRANIFLQKWSSHSIYASQSNLSFQKKPGRVFFANFEKKLVE